MRRQTHASEYKNCDSNWLLAAHKPITNMITSSALLKEQSVDLIGLR